MGCSSILVSSSMGQASALSGGLLSDACIDMKWVCALSGGLRSDACHAKKWVCALSGGTRSDACHAKKWVCGDCFPSISGLRIAGRQEVRTLASCWCVNCFLRF